MIAAFFQFPFLNPSLPHHFTTDNYTFIDFQNNRDIQINNDNNNDNDIVVAVPDIKEKKDCGPASPFFKV